MVEQSLPARTGGFRSLEPVAPIIIFLALNRLGGLRVAVVGATLWGIKLAVDRRRRGQPLGRFVPILTVALIARGVAGIITDSETVYFGLGIAGKFAGAAVLIGSAVIGKPLAALGAPMLLAATDEMQKHPVWRSTMAIITAIAGLYYLASATLDVILLQRNGIEGFVLLRFIANWPLSLAAILLALAVAQVRLPRVPGVTSALDLIETRLEELGAFPASDATNGRETKNGGKTGRVVATNDSDGQEPT
jgi:hypothetical protein